MKQTKRALLSSLLIILLCGDLFAQDKYVFSKEYTITIHGTSNLHKWDETVETVSGDGIINWNADGSFDLDEANIKMDVHSIKSREGSVMNNNTYRALKADRYPDITFTLARPVKMIPGNGDKHIIQIRASLTIAGVTKTFLMPVTVCVLGREKITFEGEETVQMTDYDVTPPVALLGTLKTGNEITIHFKTDFIPGNQL